MSPQNNFALIPPMPHMQQQHLPGAAMVPVSGGPPVMVRPVDSGNPSLPPQSGWNMQPNQNPHQINQISGPPPPSGTPTSTMPQPPTSATPPTLQPPNSHTPQNNNPPPPPPQLHPNGVAVSSPNVYNFIPGSMQPQSLPHQFPYPQLLLQPGQATTHLLQQPIMSQAQPVTSIAGGLQQFPYPVHQSHHGKSLDFFQNYVKLNLFLKIPPISKEKITGA